MMRIARYLAHCGVASRRASEELITDGKVRVNSEVVKDLSFKVDPDVDTVYLRGKPLRVETKQYFALNKPEGYVCTSGDDNRAPRAIDLIQSSQRLYTVGRLDKNSEGLLIVTNDGDLAKILTHPSYELQKKYRVTVKGRIKQDRLDELVQSGVTFQEVFYQVTAASIKRTSGTSTIINITLAEGKNREIRKMCQALDLQVKQLRRVEIAGIRLGKLPVGASRKLTPAEVRYLKKKG